MLKSGRGRRSFLGGRSLSKITTSPSVPEFVAIGALGTYLSTVPPTHQSGDLMFLQFMSDAGAQITSAPIGWTLLPVSNTFAGRRMSIIWRVATSSAEPAVNLTGLVDTTVDTASWIFTVRGVNQSTPINSVQNSARTVASISVNITGLTTTVNNCLILSLSTSTIDGISSSFSNWANASLVSISEIFDTGFPTDNGGGFAGAAGVKSAAGIVSNTTATVVSSQGNHMMIAIAP